MRELLTKHFYRDEFACRGNKCCGHCAPIELVFVQLLENFRILVDSALVVNSGFRCRTHNDTVPNSSPSSYHIKGVAADLQIPKNMSTETIFLLAKRFKLFGGVGIYDTFIHLDNGPKRNPWDERSR